MTCGRAGAADQATGRSVTPGFAIGLLLMLVGVAVTLQQFRLADAGRVLAFWPAAIIALGAVLFARVSDAYGRFWGVVWIFIGTWLLLNSLGVIAVSLWALFWPVVLTTMGAGMVIRTLRRGSGGSPRLVSARSEHLFAVFGEATRRLEHRPFEGAYLTSFLGQCRLDLRQSVVSDGAVQAVEVFGMLAEITIIVPAHWDVVLDLTPILGEVTNRHAPPRTDAVTAATAPRLVVRGAVILGEVRIDDV